MLNCNVSAIVITQNEERNLRRCLESLRWVDEIVLVDALSTDATVGIAREYGAAVHSRPWPGYAAQKRFALDRAHGEWVISLDADEELEPGLIEEIREALGTAPRDVDGFSMPRKCRYLGEWIRHGEWYPDRKVRLVRRSKSHIAGEHVHEAFIVEGRVRPLDGHILHYSFDGIVDHALRMRRYAALMAKDRIRAGARFSAARMIGEPFSRSFRNYVVLGGYRDGYRGLIITLMLYYYVLRQHIELLKLGRSPVQ